MCDVLQVYIQPSADEAERVRLSNVADSPVSPDVPQTMLLNMNGADGDVECKIIAPSGTYAIKLFCFYLEQSIFLKKMGQTRPLFVYFHSFHTTNKAQIGL